MQINGVVRIAPVTHYYDERQESPFRPFPITVVARGQTLTLSSAQGVFSKEHLDPGTKLLLDTCVLEDGWRVHDLGCGYGAVGLVVKTAYSGCAVLCSDTSDRAVVLTRQNAQALGLTVETRRSDGYAAVPESFDTVLLNPPYVAGRETVFRLIEEAHAHLVQGGLFQVVARHAKGGAMIKKRLVELFGNCDDSRKRGGYRVYISRR